REIVMVHDAPWEGSGTGYHTVFRDGDLYRMYYKAWQLTVTDNKVDIPHETFGAYAESRDGIHWTKPSLGLFEFEGSKNNNIVWVGKGAHDFTPFKDTNPDCKPDALYKAVGAGDGALLAFKSPDGIHWTPLQDKPIMTKGAFDTQNLAFWDTIRKEYRAYIRDFDNGRRGIKTATSKDFLHWTDPVWLEYPDAPDEQLYTNQIIPYYRAPHIFVGFPTRYVERKWSKSIEALPEVEHRRKRSNASERYGTATTDGLFMSSRDGLTFKRWGEAFIRPGLRNTDNWKYGDNYQNWGIVETKSDIPGAPDELSIYATESYWTGTSSELRRFTIRIDGFVSVQAPLKGGEFITKPIIFEGRRLMVNFSASAAGSMLIEILDANGNSIPGYTLDDCIEILGDDIERIVTWKQGDNVSKLAGKPVKLRFKIKDADLYSFRFIP
ncbi:MAG: hypothetical protein JXB48_01655, partial [Candidatus Latescibacteria bacterium]|nr:hypothetical protein [Candidatus Latescibacterota bacterium]